MYKSKKNWTEEVKNERADLLAKAVKEFGDSEKFQNYLKFIGTFHQYSINNQILIYFQGGRMVKGFNAWKADGRTVKKGEKAIKIYAPMMGVGFFTVLDENGAPKLDEDGKPVKVKKQFIKGFKRVNVFDVSQTEGDEIPEPDMPKMLTGDMTDEQFNELFSMVCKATTAKVGMEDISGGANGYFRPSDNTIAVNKGMSHEQTIKTLIHETTHSLLHNTEALKSRDVSREQKEIEAESVAYLVCAYLGIESADYSFDYVANWADGDVKSVLKSMDIIKKTADEIIEKMEKQEAAA